MKTKTLSSKREQKYSTHVGKAIGYYPENRVREFIQKLKEIRRLDFVRVSKRGVIEFDLIGYFEEIDTLAGKELAKPLKKDLKQWRKDSDNFIGSDKNRDELFEELAKKADLSINDDPYSDKELAPMIEQNDFECKALELANHSPQTSRDGGSLVSPDVRTPTINQASPEDTQNHSPQSERILQEIADKVIEIHADEVKDVCANCGKGKEGHMVRLSKNKAKLDYCLDGSGKKFKAEEKN